MTLWRWPKIEQGSESFPEGYAELKGKVKEMWNKNKANLGGIMGKEGNGNIMFVGLNPNVKGKELKFDHKNMNFYIKLAETKLKDSKLTDLFQDIGEPTTKKLKEKIKTGKIDLLDASQGFRKEYNSKKWKYIFCFGKDTQKYLMDILKKTEIRETKNIIHLFHYSSNTAKKKNGQRIKGGYSGIQDYMFEEIKNKIKMGK
jgi:hypothetical protein